jgi:translocation and assembly module TamB
MAPHPRTRRAFRWLGFGFLYLVLGVVLLFVVALVAINLPPVSSFVAGKVNAALEPTFKGKLGLERLGTIDLGGVSGAELVVHDAAGQKVLHARDVDVRLGVASLAWNAVVKRPDPLVIPITVISVHDLDVQLIDDGQGSPTLAQAFEPREPSAPEEEGGKTAIVIDALRVGKIQVRGALASPGPIDADLTELEASLRSDPAGTQIVVDRLDVAARQLPTVGELDGRLHADVRLPAAPESVPAPAATISNDDGTSSSVRALQPVAGVDAQQRIVAGFAGNAAGSALSADVKLEGEQLDAKVEAPSLSPATLKRLVPSLAAKSPAALFASVEGLLTNLAFHARLTQESGRVEARGRVQREGESTRVQAHVDGAGIDASALVAGATPTAVNFDADAKLTLNEAGGNGSYQLDVEKSEVAGERVPDTAIAGKLDLPRNGPVITRGTLTISEPGAPARVEYEVVSGPEGVIADVGASAKLDRSERVKKLSGGLVLTGELEALAHYDSAKDRLEAKVELGLDDLVHPSIRARRVDAVITAQGTTAAPELQIEADLRRVIAADRTLSRVTLLATGTPTELDVRGRVQGKHPARVDLHAKVKTGADNRVEAPEIVIIDGQSRATVRAERVTLGQRLHVKNLTIDGPGHAEASLVYGKSIEQLELRTEALRPVELLRMFGIETKVGSARLDLEAKLAARGQQPSGMVKGTVSDVTFGELKNIGAKLDLNLERGKLSGDADVALGRGGKTTIALKGFRPPLGPVDEKRIEQMIGELSLQGELDLGRLRGFFPLAGIERGEGVVRFDVAVEPPQQAGQHPSWRAQLASKDLVLIGERGESNNNAPDPQQARQTSPWTLRGIDVDLDASLNAEGAKLQGRLLDSNGDLINVDGKLDGIDSIQDLLAGPERLENAPFQIAVRVPSRVLEKLPSPVRPAEVQGILTLAVDAQGTLKDPRVKLDASVQRFSPASDRPRERRSVDLKLYADYATTGGKITLTGQSRKQQVLDLKTEWQGNGADLAKVEPGKPSPVRADLELALNEFPVAAVPAIQAAGVRGRLSGKVSLKGFGKDARLDVDLHSERMRIEQVRVDAFRTRVQNLDDKLVAHAEVASDGGKTTIDATTGFEWEDQLVPTIDQNVEGTMAARDFRLGMLQPLVAGTLSELDGKLDADLRAVLENGTPRVTGKAKLKDGVVQMPAIGQRFDDIDTDIFIDPGELRIEKMHARGVTGAFNLDANAKLEGLTPVSAKAEVKINERAKLPLTIEGEAVGDAWGTVETTYTHDEASKTNTINVNLSRFYIQLPDAPPQGIQTLDAAPDVRVGFRRRDGEFVAVPLQPVEEPSAPSEFKTVVQVDVNSLWVEKGQQADVTLGGKITATTGGETPIVEGKIETRRGQLDISGKTFDIERGTVTFTGDASNPTISAVARYDSPGYTVYAEYTGTATQGSLRLTSEPALSQDEILTLLMFGTPDGSFGAGGGGNQLATAVSVAGGTAAQGLNRALSDITNLDVSARIDTSTGAPRPELVLQLTPRVAAKVTQAIGEPTPGQSPDRTFLTAELRLASAWSLSTMVGDKGASALDLIWRRRY